MQCVMLVAGLGKRMRPLTDSRPKPLIEVAGKPLLAHIVEALPSEVDEIIFVIGYRGDMIRDYCGEEFMGRRVQYVEQKEQKGTADALWTCRHLLHDSFLVLCGDDLHGKESLARAVTFPRAILVAQSEHPERFGVVTVGEDGTMMSFIEKPEQPQSNLVSTGALVLDAALFAYELPEQNAGELYLTDVVSRYAQEHPVMVVEQTFWMPVGYPEDIPKAEAHLKERTAV